MSTFSISSNSPLYVLYDVNDIGYKSSLNKVYSSSYNACIIPSGIKATLFNISKYLPTNTFNNPHYRVRVEGKTDDDYLFYDIQHVNDMLPVSLLNASQASHLTSKKSPNSSTPNNNNAQASSSSAAASKVKGFLKSARSMIADDDATNGSKYRVVILKVLNLGGTAQPRTETEGELRDCR